MYLLPIIRKEVLDSGLPETVTFGIPSENIAVVGVSIHYKNRLVNFSRHTKFTAVDFYLNN